MFDLSQRWCVLCENTNCCQQQGVLAFVAINYLKQFKLFIICRHNVFGQLIDVMSTYYPWGVFYQFAEKPGRNIVFLFFKDYLFMLL